ncbi:hypothetical protein ASZ90_016083 [hydrocarbon metagenome]|uniref:Uncharacterized protein n=1 Tax=hydrocarbon metagenome TaxID=938273 RepID=A0A0W8F0B1_9ZZZZ
MLSRKGWSCTGGGGSPREIAGDFAEVRSRPIRSSSTLDLLVSTGEDSKDGSGSSTP